jgi:TolB protein
MKLLLVSFTLLNVLFISCTEKTTSDATPIVETEFTEEITYDQCESVLEIYNIETKQRRIVYQSNEHFEAPNWVHRGNFLIFNKNGKLYKIDVKGGIPELINTDFADKNNNDHGISPDGTQLVISHHINSAHTSMIYTLPIEGGIPTQITAKGPSYWHGWSPDGNTLAYCANRNNNYDIYSIPTLGGKETRLTTAEGLDDGPDYTYDGKYIYFNSVRTGNMKIWRMKTDGSEQEQMTFDACNDWFAHPSPDGKWAVMVTYISKVDPGNHPGNKNVCLRMMPLNGGQPEILFHLFGGQGTINVPSWSVDSKEFAFVSYRKKE